MSVIRPQFRQQGQGYLAVAEYLVPVYGAKGETIFPGDPSGSAGIFGNRCSGCIPASGAGGSGFDSLVSDFPI